MFEGTEGDAPLFTTRNAVRLNYLDERDFIRWDVENYKCFVANDSLPQTEFRCRIPGVIKVTAYSATSEISKYLQISPSIKCFQWHVYKNPLSVNEGQVKERFHIFEIDLSVWIVDMRYASEDEKLNRASSPSNYSRDLTNQYKTLGQYPKITLIQEDVIGFAANYTVSEFDQDNGLWRNRIQMLSYRQPKILITGSPVPLFDCLIRSEYAVLPADVYNETIEAEDRLDEMTMLRLRANVTRPVIVKDACGETSAVLLTDDYVYMTSDGFVSSEPLYIPDNGTFNSMPIVEHAAFTYKYLVLLINSSLHFMEKRTRTWHSIQVPGDEPVIGLRGRDTCHTGHFYMLMEESLVVWTRYAVFISTNDTHSSVGDFSRVEIPCDAGNVAIEDVAFHSIPSHIAIALASENAHLPMLYIVIIDVILRQEAYIFEQIKVNNNLMFLVSGNLSFLAWDDDIMIYYFDKTFYDVDLPSGHLVEPGETIQQVVVSPTDEMVVRTSRNRLQYGVPGDVGSVMSVTVRVPLRVHVQVFKTMVVL